MVAEKYLVYPFLHVFILNMRLSVETLDTITMKVIY